MSKEPLSFEYRTTIEDRIVITGFVLILITASYDRYFRNQDKSSFVLFVCLLIGIGLYFYITRPKKIEIDDVFLVLPSGNRYKKIKLAEIWRIRTTIFNYGVLALDIELNNGSRIIIPSDKLSQPDFMSLSDRLNECCSLINGDDDSRERKSIERKKILMFISVLFITLAYITYEGDLKSTEGSTLIFLSFLLLGILLFSVKKSSKKLNIEDFFEQRNNKRLYLKRMWGVPFAFILCSSSVGYFFGNIIEEEAYQGGAVLSAIVLSFIQTYLLFKTLRAKIQERGQLVFKASLCYVSYFLFLVGNLFLVSTLRYWYQLII